jgi:acyl transferase domain-containing protein
VKTNIGHLDAAAGVAGLIKTVLALEHGVLPPNLHFSEPNPRIDFAGSPFYVNASQAEWKRAGEIPRRAGVSSFGIGGTNAHVVVEEAPFPGPSAPSRPVQVLTLSAKSPEALDQVGANLAGHLEEHGEQSLSDVAYTLHRGRAAFPHRRVVVARTHEEAAQALRASHGRRVPTRGVTRGARPVVFMFSGQGSQYVGMGRGLYETEPLFREVVDECATALTPRLGVDLRTVLYPPSSRVEEARARLATTSLTQPALFVVEYALGRLFMAWGVEPQAMLGHSIGEYVAACLSSVLSLTDALDLVAVRGRLMEIPGGGMLAVPLAEAELRATLPAGLSIAAVNGAALCAVSGPTSDVSAFEARLAARGIRTQAIHAAAAFHSAMMEPILDSFRQSVSRIVLAPPSIPYISNVTGTWMTVEDARDPAFWDGLQEVARDQEPILVEVGPGRTLAALARPASTAERPLEILSTIRHPHDDVDDATVLQTAVGRLWLAGAAVDWVGYHGGEERRRVALPTYPFERQRHWILPPAARFEAVPQRPEALVKRADMGRWFYAPSWRRSAPHRPPIIDPEGSWLIFTDEIGIASAVARRLQQDGVEVTMVMRGDKFSRLDDGSFTIGSDGRRDYDQLVTELGQSRMFPRRVLHLWSLFLNDDGPLAPDGLEAGQARGFYSLLFLAQSLAEAGVREPITIGVVVNGLHDVTGETVFRPDRATVLGPTIVIPQEYANVHCRTIDVVLPSAGAGDDLLAQQLVFELERPSETAVVAYRGGHRWVQNLEPAALDGPPTPPVLRRHGVYVITGGLGGIGLVLARHLAETVAARLVLIGRSPVPPRTEWAQWLEAHGDDDVTTTRIHSLQALEEAGGEVLTISADVANREQLAHALDAARQRFGVIHGVVHAAGIPGGGIIQLKTPEAAAQVLAPKLLGTLWLWDLLEGDRLDFFLLCASITGVVGGPGQVDYCAANAFLDAFARSRAAHGVGTRVISVDWDAWQEVGMAAKAAVPSAFAARRARELAEAIMPAEGVVVFERVLGTPLPEVIVSTRDLPRLVEAARRVITEAKPEPAAGPAQETPPAPSGRSGLPTPFVAPSTDLERTIAEVWQELLGIEPIGLQDDFFDAGGHSLLATQVMSRLYHRLRVDVPLRTLFEARTIAEFAERVNELTRSAGDREEIEL